MEKLQYEGLVLLDSWAQLRGAAVAEKRSLGCYCTNEEEAKKQRNADDLFGAARRSPPRRPANKPQNHTQTTRRRIWHAGSKQLTLSWCMWQQPCHACVVGQPASCTVHRHQHVFLAVRLAGGLLRERERWRELGKGEPSPCVSALPITGSPAPAPTPNAPAPLPSDAAPASCRQFEGGVALVRVCFGGFSVSVFGTPNEPAADCDSHDSAGFLHLHIVFTAPARQISERLHYRSESGASSAPPEI